jgi:predicted Ser/Thr protein kinase
MNNSKNKRRSKRRSKRYSNKFGININDKIKSGGSGDIYILNLGPKKYILKYIREDGITSGSVTNEVEIQNIAASLGIAPKILTYGKDFIIMDYINGINLYDYRTKYPQNKYIIEKINKAYDKLHHANILHNDAVPGNILIDNNNKVYIIDYGTSEYNKNNDNYFKYEKFNDDFFE